MDSSLVSGSLRAHHKESCAETSSNPGEFIYEIGILVRLFPLTLSGVNSPPCALTHSFPKFHRMGKRPNEGSWPSSAGAGLGASHPSKGLPPAPHLIVWTWGNKGSVWLHHVFKAPGNPQNVLGPHLPHAVSEQRLCSVGWCSASVDGGVHDLRDFYSLRPTTEHCNFSPYYPRPIVSFK